VAVIVSGYPRTEIAYIVDDANAAVAAAAAAVAAS
jgi:hypothetical protein